MTSRQLARQAISLLEVYGIDTRKLLIGFASTPRFIRTLNEYRLKSNDGPFRYQTKHLFPILSDFAAQAGTANGHYFHQDLWAAQKIYKSRPVMHLDIGSRIDGFVAHLLAFMPVTVIDIRPLSTNVSGLTFIQSDATDLAGIQDSSVESLSCLHAIEHFGLGRYGDPVEPEACFRAMRALARVLRPGGHLYFSVPVGIERVSFNAHRIFAPQTILDTFSGLKLLDFSAVNDEGDLVANCSPDGFVKSHFACGLFEFTKP